MADKILATFRIDREEWEAFKNAASAQGSNASAVILELTREYRMGKQVDANTAPRTIDLDTNVPPHLDRIEQRLDRRLEVHLDSIDELIDKRIESVRSQLQEQVDSLRGKLKARLVR